MTNLNIPILQPERSQDETMSDYQARRESAHNYVKAVIGGTVFWNPKVQGTYTNENRVRLTKSGRRIFKAHKRLGRAELAQANETAAAV